MTAPTPPDDRPAAPPAGRPTGRADLAALAALVAASLAVHGWLYAHTFTTARDSIGFAQLALQYEDPARAAGPAPFAGPLDVMRRAEPPHPPGYPLIVLAVSKAYRAIDRPADDGELASAMLRSTQLASVLGALVLLLPSYALGRRLFGRGQGFAAALLFQVLPVSARMTSDGLTEAWYLVFLACGLLAAVTAVRRGRAGGFLAAGLCGGLAYLVRPEGLLVSLTAVACALLLGLARRVGLSGVLLRGGAVVVGTAFVAGPYMLAIGGLTLKNSGTSIVGGDTAAAVPRAVGGPALFAAQWDPLTDGSKLAWMPGGIFKEAAKTFHYAPLGLALLGAAFAARRLRVDPAPGVLFAFAALNLGVLVVLAGRVGYVSERHTLPLAFVGCVFAAHGCFGARPFWRALFGERLTRPAGAWAVYAVVVISCLPATARPLHENRFGHRIVGAYLAAHAGPGDVIIDPYNWAQFYSGRAVRGVPPDPSPARIRWAVLEDGEAPHATLSNLRLVPAVNVRDDNRNPPTVALEWPDSSDPKGHRKVVLLRQDLGP